MALPWDVPHAAQQVHSSNEIMGRMVMMVGVGDVCFFLTMRCFNDAMFSNS